MDKPLSQERPKPLGDGIGLFIGMYEGVKTSGLEKKYMLKHVQILLAEVKRLQAIEAERDRYKKTVDQILKTQELETFDDPTLLDLIYRIAKGAERNE